MEALSIQFQTVAIDQRGYELSDKPKGVDNYDMRLLVGDVVAVIKHLGRDKAIVVGPLLGRRRRGLERELSVNPQQRLNSRYPTISSRRAHT
jgi:hypothetical protein